MGYIADGIVQAFYLLINLDEEMLSAIFTTVRASTLSTLAALVLGLPLGFLLGYSDFPGRKQIRSVVDTLLALPTVVVGLLVYTFLSSRGPFGKAQLLFSVSGIIIAQTVLILPIVISLSATAIESLDLRLHSTLYTLGARGNQIILTSIREARFAILTAGVTAYGRAISEVGVSMMIGGNIKWNTRTITTAIALETGKGEFALGIALGIVLLLLAFMVNGFLIVLRRRI
jgi:tungstate transport system permease protein